jgi:hypothetical protein
LVKDKPENDHPTLYSINHQNPFLTQLLNHKPFYLARYNEINISFRYVRV